MSRWFKLESRSSLSLSEGFGEVDPLQWLTKGRTCMMRQRSMVSLIVVSLLFAFIIAAAPAAAESGPLHAGCWVVVDPNDDATLGNAYEVLCVEASGGASIRESGIYGEGVKGCNVVTISSQGGKLVIDVDYKHCTNDAPSHKLMCDAPTASGSYPCVQVMASSGGGMPVKLAPLPAGQ